MNWIIHVRCVPLRDSNLLSLAPLMLVKVIQDKIYFLFLLLIQADFCVAFKIQIFKKATKFEKR